MIQWYIIIPAMYSQKHSDITNDIHRHTFKFCSDSMFLISHFFLCNWLLLLLVAFQSRDNVFYVFTVDVYLLRKEQQIFMCMYRIDMDLIYENDCMIIFLNFFSFIVIINTILFAFWIMNENSFIVFHKKSYVYFSSKRNISNTAHRITRFKVIMNWIRKLKFD